MTSSRIVGLRPYVRLFRCTDDSEVKVLLRLVPHPLTGPSVKVEVNVRLSERFEKTLIRTNSP